MIFFCKNFLLYGKWCICIDDVERDLILIFACKRQAMLLFAVGGTKRLRVDRDEEGQEAKPKEQGSKKKVKVKRK